MVHNENQFGSHCEPHSKHNLLIIIVNIVVIQGQVGPPKRTPREEGFFIFRDIKTKRVINRVTSWGGFIN